MTDPAPCLTSDPQYPRLIVIPTIGTPEVVGPSFRSLRANIPDGTRVVVVINPKVQEHGAETAKLVQLIGLPDTCRLDVLLFDGPIGFGGANNAGIAYANETGGVGEVIVTFNDDLRATPGWLESLEAALTADTIQFGGEAPNKEKGRVAHPRAAWGKVGIVGPVTTIAAGPQGAVQGEELARLRSLGHAEFSRSWRSRAGDKYLAAAFLSGFCMAISRECANALLIREVYPGGDAPDYRRPCVIEPNGINKHRFTIRRYGVFDAEQYPIAGYEDNDICVRATNAGYRLAVDWANYVGHVGHQSFDAAFPEMQRGMRNRGRYYAKFEAETQRRGQRLIGVYRVRIGSVQDLRLFQASLARHAAILDGVSVLLTNNPARDLPNYPDWRSLGGLAEIERTYLQAIAPTVKPGDDWKTADDIDLLRKMTEGWIAGTLVGAQGSRFKLATKATDIVVDVWTGPFNERVERNASITAAQALNPDWLLSIDHDEVIEDRIRRGHFERWMMHPDPMVSQYDFGWLDHWNDTQHFRTDHPWGDGGRYTGGRHGRRMWRACPANAAGDLIYAGTADGLHCGNIPDAGVTAVRCTGARWRHFGYVRQLDRLERYKKYSAIDPNPDPSLVGGTDYGHIVCAEGMRIEFYSARNGIALHMLCYPGEDPGLIADKLDSYYALVDHIVLVWTDAASPDDPDLGMSRELKDYARLFQADVLHCPLRDERGVNFAAVRNAAIEHISQINEANNLGIGWGLFMDPDEGYGEPLLAQINLRRMAESTETYGWIMRYENPTIDGRISGSDSVRLHRLDPAMRMRGRVHESFDEAIRTLSKAGGKPALRVSPLTGVNPGLNDPSTIAGKIRGYAEGLIAELQDNPHNGGAWASLGLQFEAEGRIDEAMQAYQLSCQTMPESFLGYRAMMQHHLRIALAFAAETQSRLSSAHDFRTYLDRIVEFLGEVAQPPTNPAGKLVLSDLALPPAPPEYSAAEAAAEFTYAQAESIGRMISTQATATREAVQNGAAEPG